MSDAFLDTSTCLLELIDSAANYDPARGINPENFEMIARGMITVNFGYNDEYIVVF